MNRDIPHYSSLFPTIKVSQSCPADRYVIGKFFYTSTFLQILYIFFLYGKETNWECLLLLIMCVSSPLTLCCGHLLSTGDTIQDLGKCEPFICGQVRNSHDLISSLWNTAWDIYKVNLGADLVGLLCLQTNVRDFNKFWQTMFPLK